MPTPSVIFNDNEHTPRSTLAQELPDTSNQSIHVHGLQQEFSMVEGGKG